MKIPNQISFMNYSSKGNSPQHFFPHGFQLFSIPKNLNINNHQKHLENILNSYQKMSISRQFLLLFGLIFCCLAAANACIGCSQSQPYTNRGPQVPCFFIFGDSLVDNGNNNDMLTLARADYSPYGVDFPQGATGRFTNGRTFVDVLGTKWLALLHLHDHVT